jgi:hypothetical protein
VSVTTLVAEGWLINGEPLETYARTIDSRDGWDDTPPLRGDNLVLFGRHGQLRRRKRFDPGRKSLTFTLHGTDETGAIPQLDSKRRARYEAALDGLLRLLFPPGGGAFTVTRVYADGSRRQAECEVVSALTPSVMNDDTGRVTVDLSIPGSFWEDVDATTYRLATSTVGTVQTVEVYSLAGQTGPCGDPVVVVTGPCTAVTVRDTLTGSGFTYAGAIGSGQTLTVDAGAFTAVFDDGTPASVLTDLTTYDAQLLEVSAAPSAVRGPSVDVTLTGATTATSVVFTTRRKWLR